MANPFSALLGRITSASQAGADMDSIVVNANKRPNTQTNTDDAPSIPVGNGIILQDVQDAADKAPQRKGVFGSKGTLRDILGTIGDAFLLAGGKNRIYAPKKQQEAESDAMVGFTENPQAAFERLANVNPEMAGKLQDQYQDNQSRQAAYNSLSQSRDAQIAKGVQGQVDSFMGTVTASLQRAKTQEQYDAILRSASRVAAKRGFSPEQLGIDLDNMSDDDKALLPGWGSSAEKQEKLEIAHENATANTTRANRVPQPRAAPQPTMASVLAPIATKIARGEELTPGEQQLYDDNKRPKKQTALERMTGTPPQTAPKANLPSGADTAKYDYKQINGKWFKKAK